MKRMSVLVLMLLCLCLTALGEVSPDVSLEVDASRLPVYESTAPFLEELGAVRDDALPVLVLLNGQSRQLEVTVRSGNLRNRQVTILSGDETVARVRGTYVQGVKPGETLLTISSQQDPSVSLQYRVYVIQPVSRITITAPQPTVAVGSELQLTPAFSPEDASLKAVNWSSSDESVATVSEDGTVRGIRRGYVRITATARDGSNVRANVSVQVTQNAEEIRLKKTELSVDVGRTAMMYAEVLPQETNDKNVVWSSSDESIATVNSQGRVTGVSVGECTITCTSKTVSTVQASAKLYVHQPVTGITFGDAPAVYAGESARLTWTVEPASASIRAVSFSSSNEKVLRVSITGTVTGVAPGEAYVTATATDGSNRRARVKVKVFQHVTGVHMVRNTAYIDVRETATAGAVVEPKGATNTNMTWESADTSVATVEPVKKQLHRVRITGVSEGETVVTGTTEDGGYQTSIRVLVGDWSHMAKITSAEINGKGQILIGVKNITHDMPLTTVTVEIEAFQQGGAPVAINLKDGTNVIKGVYSRQLDPGKTTHTDKWKLEDLDPNAAFQWITVRVTQYQIDGDWVKTLQKRYQPRFEYTPGK